MKRISGHETLFRHSAKRLSKHFFRTSKNIFSKMCGTLFKLPKEIRHVLQTTNHSLNESLSYKCFMISCVYFGNNAGSPSNTMRLVRRAISSIEAGVSDSSQLETSPVKPAEIKSYAYSRF